MTAADGDAEPVRSVLPAPANVDAVRHPDENDPGNGDGDDPEGHDVDLEDEAPPGLSWPRVAVLGAALAFLGFALGVFLVRERHPGPDSLEVGFYQDMATHHEQALDLSLLVLADGTEPTVRSFAEEVLIFQSRELGEMEETLSHWGVGRDDRPAQAMTWMDTMEPVPIDQMPGMISDEQMAELDAAEGTDADALFLELMAEHHRGGLHMAEYAAEHADDSEVRDLAFRLLRNQAIEINEYSLAAERLGLPADIERVDVPDAP